MIGQKDGGDGRNTTKAQKADSMAITSYLPKVGSFFNELDLWGNYAQW